MNENRIAIVVDSCTDVPVESIEAFGMYVVPMQVNYEKESYLDKVTITSQEVCDRLSVEVPKTSTPTPAVVTEVFDRIVADGYTQAVAVTISSGLSSTFDLVRSVAAGVPRLDVLMVGTLNIGLGAGLVALAVARLVDAGATLDDVKRAAPHIVADTHVYFSVDTLDYLRRGGRIGKMAHLMGGVLDVHPVISCNEEGVYYTVAKARGRRKSLKRAMECALEQADRADSCVMGVAHANAAADADMVLRTLGPLIPQASVWCEGEISPALLVHTGPGLVGIAVQGDNWRRACGKEEAGAVSLLGRAQHAVAERARRIAQGRAAHS